MQVSLFDENQEYKVDTESAVRALVSAWKAGVLGGAEMPEDAAPKIQSKEQRLLFFTLPMALNYQRNSYTLWKSAAALYDDEDGRNLFDPIWVSNTDPEKVQEILVHHRVALQPNRHPEIWRKISNTLATEFDGSISNLIERSDYSVDAISSLVRVLHKRGFPYLSGPKIFNYWLYVLEQYCDIQFSDRQLISVAPDTHVVQATIRLGLVPAEYEKAPNIQGLVSDSWESELAKFNMCPIDIHTPLWLWSRSGFPSLREFLDQENSP